MVRIALKYIYFDLLGWEAKYGEATLPPSSAQQSERERKGAMLSGV